MKKETTHPEFALMNDKRSERRRRPKLESDMNVSRAQNLTNGFSRLTLICNPLPRESSQLIKTGTY